MSSTTATATDAARDGVIPFAFVRDMMAVAQRNLIAYRRVPQLLVFSTIQPVIFVLMFRYVFGSAIVIPGFPYQYVDSLMPGIFVQTVVFGAIATAIGLSTDVKSGLLERFRSLPMARSAVPPFPAGPAPAPTRPANCATATRNAISARGCCRPFAMSTIP